MRVGVWEETTGLRGRDGGEEQSCVVELPLGVEFAVGPTQKRGGFEVGGTASEARTASDHEPAHLNTTEMCRTW